MAKKYNAFTDNYKKYDTSNGHGSAEEWKKNLYERMTSEDAARIVEEARETPWSILGVSMGATPGEIKKAFWALMQKWHPDNNPDNPNATAITQKLIAAYTILCPKKKT